LLCCLGFANRGIWKSAATGKDLVAKPWELERTVEMGLGRGLDLTAGELALLAKPLTAPTSAGLMLTLASHRQQSAKQSHKRTVIGALQTGQLHIEIDPDSQNLRPSTST